MLCPTKSFHTVFQGFDATYRVNGTAFTLVSTTRASVCTMHPQPYGQSVSYPLHVPLPTAHRLAAKAERRQGAGTTGRRDDDASTAQQWLARDLATAQQTAASAAPYKYSTTEHCV